MAITEPKPRKFRGDYKVARFPAANAVQLYQGAAVQEAGDGSVQNATGVGTTFTGFLIEGTEGINSATGDQFVEVATKGEVLIAVAHSADIDYNEVGATVYLTDNDTFTTVSTSAQAIGKISEVPPEAVGASPQRVWVSFEGVQERSL